MFTETQTPEAALYSVRPEVRQAIAEGDEQKLREIFAGDRQTIEELEEAVN